MAKQKIYFQPISLKYTESLAKNIPVGFCLLLLKTQIDHLAKFLFLWKFLNGWVMPFPNLEQFKSRYGEEQKNAPTNSLIDTFGLLVPQIRVVNQLTIDGKPNPVAFLAYEPVDPRILSFIFSTWVEVWYPESEHQSLKSLCTPDKFEWQPATPDQLKWWSPVWTLAKHLTEQEYKLSNDTFNFLFAPGRKGNTVELVSWPPFSTPKGYKSSIGIVISHQSDLSDRRINLHFKMKRWVVKRGENVDINLQSKTTHCYVRRLISWLGNYDLCKPNVFTVLEAKNFKRENQNGTESNNFTNEKEKKFERRWKDKKILEILERLSADIPDIEDVLQSPLNYIKTKNTDILIPARSWEKAGWGTGFTISDSRRLLKQIIGFLPAGVTLTKPWQKIKHKKLTKQLFIEQPQQKYKKLFKPKTNNNLPDISQGYKKFLQQRANNITLHVCYITSEVRAAIKQVAYHYFGNSLKLEFHSSQSLADPIQYKKSKNKKCKKQNSPQLTHIKKFGQQYQPDNPEPIIVEILSQDHPSYRGDADPKSYIKSELPKYNLIPQCIVSGEKIDGETIQATSNQAAENNLLNRALSSILDAIMPFDQNYPLSTDEDNNAYAGFYVISRNKATSNQSFNEPALVVIYKNEIKVLLPAQDTKLRSFPEAICYLANKTKSTNRRDENVVNTMLEQLSINYSNADNIYLYAHAQNTRTYWQWLQDEKFDCHNPPTQKMTIIRIRDSQSNEVAQG